MLTSARHALRLVRLNPGSSAAVVVTLSLAIAANGMLFTLINAALLTPLPVRDPGSLVKCRIRTSRTSAGRDGRLPMRLATAG
jgi:hypothetical protein